MAGAAKRRLDKEKKQESKERQDTKSTKSSSSNTSSSGKATSSAKSPSSAVSSSNNVRVFDGNRDPGDGSSLVAPVATVPTINPRNLDLGMGVWATIRGTDFAKHPPRPNPSTLGQATKTGLNTYNVNFRPAKQVYQFEVLIGNGVEKRALVSKVWRSQEVTRQLGGGYIFDGNRLAWSQKSIDREIRCIVDLDAEEGRQTRPGGKENKHRVVIRQTNVVRFDSMTAYLQGKTDFDSKILEAINFLDHLLRENPSKHYTAIKRSFFSPGNAGRFDLGDGIEALKGVYQTMRIAHAGPNQARLSINVDVSNGTFWNACPLNVLALKLLGARDMNDLGSVLRAQGEKHRYARDLNRLRKLHVQAMHRKGHVDSYVVDRFLLVSAKNHKFEKDGKSITLFDYYRSAYNITLQCPDLPLVQTTRKNTVLPMELLNVKINQRYPFKLSDRQTQKMITFAVEPPAKRMERIKEGLSMLDWPNDPVHKAFGLQIETKHAVVDSRLIPAPVVKFGQGDAKPGTSGRWDLRGKKFLQPNPTPLKSWAVCVASGRRGGKPDKAVVDNFTREFVKAYQNHGGRVENKNPTLVLAQGNDVADWVTACWNAAGNQSQSRPQILIFMLPDKDSVTYGRIKRSCECRYGVVSQCMQYAQVAKCNGQYLSNVCMKFNAKLGGITSRAVGAKTGGPGGAFQDKSTMIIGADVSHAAPGSQAPSMAALTVSMDKLATRYAAVCQTNGYRNEMIATDIFNTDVKPLVQRWLENVGGGKMPQRVIYMRDGVSEAQYDHVLQQEIHDLKEMMKQFATSSSRDLTTQFLVIVAGKRHHVRFFPEQNKGDRNGNPLPGTLVETGVTHPFENDFYLCSHAAIKGTARPVHYHVILNEPKMPNEEIQTLLYEHSYQYIRATTPVSIHSAVYYAHIASNRAIPHDPKWTGSADSSTSITAKPKDVPQSHGQSGGKSGGQSGSSSGPPAEFDKLMPMPNQGQIQWGMWYI